VRHELEIRGYLDDADHRGLSALNRYYAALMAHHTREVTEREVSAAFDYLDKVLLAWRYSRAERYRMLGLAMLDYADTVAPKPADKQP